MIRLVRPNTELKDKAINFKQEFFNPKVPSFYTKDYVGAYTSISS